MHYSLRNEQECGTMPFLAMLKKVRKKFWLCPFTWIHTESQLGLFWAETHPLSKFRGNPFNSFCIMMLTNQQTDLGENMTSLVEDKKLNTVLSYRRCISVVDCWYLPCITIPHTFLSLSRPVLNYAGHVGRLLKIMWSGHWSEHTIFPVSPVQHVNSKLESYLSLRGKSERFTASRTITGMRVNNDGMQK